MWLIVCRIKKLSWLIYPFDNSPLSVRLQKLEDQVGEMYTVNDRVSWAVMASMSVHGLASAGPYSGDADYSFMMPAGA
jgi:hypothetical protein